MLPGEEEKLKDHILLKSKWGARAFTNYRIDEQMEAYTNLDTCVRRRMTINCKSVDFLNDAIQGFVSRNEIFAKKVLADALNGDGGSLVPHCFYGRDGENNSILSVGNHGM